MSKNWYMCTLHNTKVGYQITFAKQIFFANFYVFLISKVLSPAINSIDQHAVNNLQIGQQLRHRLPLSTLSSQRHRKVGQSSVPVPLHLCPAAGYLA